MSREFAVPNAPEEEDAAALTTAQYLEKVSYDSVSAVRANVMLVLRRRTLYPLIVPMMQIAAIMGGATLNAEQLDDLKSKSTCHKCKTMGHWKSDHNQDGSLKQALYCATAQFPIKASEIPWKEVQKIVDKVHNHVCGHASFSNIQTLPKRNDLWNQEIKKY